MGREANSGSCAHFQIVGPRLKTQDLRRSHPASSAEATKAVLKKKPHIVISLTTLHNLRLFQLKTALAEIDLPSVGVACVHDLAGLLPDAQVKIYPDAGHGFLFQHHREFGDDVLAFLPA